MMSQEIMQRSNGIFSGAVRPAARAPEDVGLRRARAGCGETRRSTAVAVAMFCLTMLLLNGVYFHEDAQRRAYGVWRDVWVAATRPARALSETSRLDGLRRTLEHHLEQWGIKL